MRVHPCATTVFPPFPPRLPPLPPPIPTSQSSPRSHARATRRPGHAAIRRARSRGPPALAAAAPRGGQMYRRRRRGTATAHRGRARGRPAGCGGSGQGIKEG
eukprot:277240-Chlamydomonas_euryale.AAC.1